jgi:3-dehydroquinate synthase
MRAKYFYTEERSDLDHFFSDKSENWSSVFILVDKNTHNHCLPLFLENVNFNGEIEILEIEAGEESKDIEIATGLWLALAELKADRKALIINLGGGVVSDLGAWVATNYKRGVSFINVPTTLLAMVDASIGGKTGIDLGGIKNLIGSFTEPEFVLCHPPFLNTLAIEEWYSGYAEMIKHSLITDADLWDKIRLVSPDNHEEIKKLIEENAKIKIAIVAIDFNEKGERKKLNFGHTIGHAIEAISLDKNKVISHGHAIAIGMLLASIISNEMGMLSRKELDQINDFILKYYQIPNWLIEEKEDIKVRVLNDKKNESSKLLMILLSKIGEAVINVEVSSEQIEASIKILTNAK